MDIKNKITQLPEKPHIIAVHDYRVGRKLAGEAPVILFGHNHIYSVNEQKGSLLINAGSSGAAGFRGIMVNKPYTVALLHFRPQNGVLALMAIDY